LSEIHLRGELVGFGARCGLHMNEGETTTQCKKACNLAAAGCDATELVVRLKRWLVAGLDDTSWVADSQRTHHFGMGGGAFGTSLTAFLRQS
jgi:hypothetical protein